MIDLDRITHPLRLAKGSHQPGSDKGCAMNVISYINGDKSITDYPECSARPLSSLVQMCNDELADADGMLSPENSVLVLDLGWRTVGTAGVSDAMHALWIAEVLDNPDWGVVQFAKGDGVAAVRRIAELHRDAAAGAIPFAWPAWSVAWSVAWSAAWSAAESAAWSAAESAAWSAAWSAAESAARSAAWSAAESAARSAAESAAESAARSAAESAAESAARSVAWSVAWSAAWSAAESAARSAARSAAIITFTHNAIESWRQIAGLDNPSDISTDDINAALDQIGI